MGRFASPTSCLLGRTRAVRASCACWKGVSGATEVQVRFDPRFDYARQSADITACDGGVIARSAAGEALVLACPGEFAITGLGAVSRLRITRGDRVWLALAARAIARRHRSRRGSRSGSRASTRLLGALVSRLLVQRPVPAAGAAQCSHAQASDSRREGALVAAPTTSLPEVIGGVGNWDYRYTWLRDSGMSLDALMLAGYHDEAARFFDWIEDLCLCCDGEMQIMYSIDGTPTPPEHKLDHLDGYRGSRPVRIGNGTAR